MGGRYWTTKGPQQAFYMPAPYLKTGANEVIILELEQGFEGCEVYFDDKADFSGAPSPPANPCEGEPKAGDVLYMRDCDASLADHMAWELQDAENGPRSSRLETFAWVVDPQRTRKVVSPAPHSLPVLRQRSSRSVIIRFPSMASAWTSLPMAKRQVRLLSGTLVMVRTTTSFGISMKHQRIHSRLFRTWMVSVCLHAQQRSNLWCEGSQVQVMDALSALHGCCAGFSITWW